MAIQRQTAYKCAVQHLLKGHYIQKEGWEPSYVETSIGNISRASITGVIVWQEERSLILDDGTGQIRLTSFEDNNPLVNARIGDKVLTISRPRLYNDQIYLNVEIIKKIEEKWLLLRKLELEQLQPTQTVTSIPASPASPQTPEPNASPGERILNLIQELDKGQGANVDEVIRAMNIENGEKIIENLLQEGEIYEIRPGKLKLL